MSAARFSVIALTLLAACDGNPFAAVPGSGSSTSVSTLSTTTQKISAKSDIERHEVLVTDKGSDTGNGFAFRDGKINYDAANDTFTIDNLAFDGANVYARDTTLDGVMTSDVKAFKAALTEADANTGAQIDQFSYRALYGTSTTGRSKFAIVRTGAYVPYGFGGFVYSRSGGVTLPTSGQAHYTGDYTALRDANSVPGETGGDKLFYVTGDMTMDIDFEDFDADVSNVRAGAVQGQVTNRRIFSLDGAEVTQTFLDAINTDNNLTGNAITELPTMVFSVGPGALDNNGEVEGPLTSQIPKSSGGAQLFEDGKYYAVISGTNADEVVGVIVVTSKINSVEWRETGGFILYRP